MPDGCRAPAQGSLVAFHAKLARPPTKLVGVRCRNTQWMVTNLLAIVPQDYKVPAQTKVFGNAHELKKPNASLTENSSTLSFASSSDLLISFHLRSRSSSLQALETSHVTPDFSSNAPFLNSPQPQKLGTGASRTSTSNRLEMT